MRRRLLLACAALAGLAPSRAAAPTYPDAGRPVRLVVPYPVGGGGDALGRFLAQRLEQRLGVPVVVLNRPGATSVIGATEVARAPADGHTLLLNTVGFLVHLPHQRSNLPYDPWRDFTPITPLMEAALVLVAHPALGVSDLPGLLSHARGRPGQLAYASWGTGGASHFYFVLLERHAGISLTHVPYKGLTEIHPDLLENRVQLTFDATLQGQEYVRRGRLKALAVTGERRISGLPKVPTFQEQGVPGLEWARGMGLFGPGGLPAKIAERLHAEVEAILAEPASRSFMEGFGFEPGTLAPGRYAELLRADSRHWGPLLRQLGMRLD